ncbi:MAG: hypothetical protein R6X12_06575 [bacterium]
MLTLITLTILTPAVPDADRGFWLGPAAVASPTAAYSDYYYSDGHGQPVDTFTVINKDGYWGMALLAGYAPTDWVRFQATLLEMRRTWSGCVNLALAPAVGLDVQFELPVRWRVRPYLWAGGNWTVRIAAALPPGTVSVEPMMMFNTGPGVSVLITPRLSAFFETGLAGVSRYSEVDTRDRLVWNVDCSYIAVERPKLGVR